MKFNLLDFEFGSLWGGIKLKYFKENDRKFFEDVQAVATSSLCLTNSMHQIVKHCIVNTCFLWGSLDFGFCSSISQLELKIPDLKNWKIFYFTYQSNILQEGF